jgi:hypothetical protein
MSREQTVRISWCLCHGFVAAYVLYSAQGSVALTALSHLIFFDAISATICVVVDVFCNFEVWKRSSIRHPFGSDYTLHVLLKTHTNKVNSVDSSEQRSWLALPCPFSFSSWALILSPIT